MCFGMIPIAGQIADARDILSGIYGVATATDANSKEAWATLGLAVVVVIPIAGDAAKAARMAGNRAAKEAAGAVVDNYYHLLIDLSIPKYLSTFAPTTNVDS